MHTIPPFHSLILAGTYATKAVPAINPTSSISGPFPSTEIVEVETEVIVVVGGLGVSVVEIVVVPVA